MDTTTQKRIGQVLLALGFLAGAFITVREPSSVTWGPYAVALAATIVGAVLLRIAERSSGAEEHQVQADLATLETSLIGVLDEVRAMNADYDEGDPFAYGPRIDATCMDRLNDFVEAREALIHSYGLTEYAAVMDSFALGERSLNRAWCASADGYVDEVKRCLDRAERYFEVALAVVQENRRGKDTAAA